MVHPYFGMGFSLRKEGNSDKCYNTMNLKDIMLSEINAVKKN